jgi:hypothetical protein
MSPDMTAHQGRAVALGDLVKGPVLDGVHVAAPKSAMCASVRLAGTFQKWPLVQWFFSAALNKMQS